LLAGSDATLEWTSDPKRPLMLHRAGSRPEGMEVEGAGIGNAELLHACLTDYLSAVAEQRPTAFGSTELARRTLQLILAIYESATVGQRVDL
jgi:predicted dehydrogenase